jgi:hypothetical protein
MRKIKEALELGAISPTFEKKKLRRRASLC